MPAIRRPSLVNRNPGYDPLQRRFDISQNIQHPAQPTRSRTLSQKLRGYGELFTNTLIEQFFPSVGAIIGGLVGSAPGVLSGNFLLAGIGAATAGRKGYEIGGLLNTGSYNQFEEEVYKGLRPFTYGKKHGDINLTDVADFAHNQYKSY